MTHRPEPPELLALDPVVIEGASGPAAAPPSAPAVRCRHVVKIYEAASGRVFAVRGIDLDVEGGCTTGVVGPSGSGKSSLLRMIAGLELPSAGSVEIDGIDLTSLSTKRRARTRAQLVTHVHQRPPDNLLSHLTAAQQLARLVPREADPDVVADALQTLGLDGHHDHRPAELSSGEQQRLALARAIVAGHRLVIADEPTAQLDGESTRAVLAAIDRLAARGVTVLVATHDARVLPHLQQVIALRDGAIASITEAGTERAVIDRGGRLQLPMAARDAFSEDRAVIRVDDDGNVRIERP